MFTKLLSLLCPPSPVAAAPAAPATPPAEADERPGCGWFDSSHALQQGLQVREHADAGTLAAELPLAAWLELQLSGWRVTHPA